MGRIALNRLFFDCCTFVQARACKFAEWLQARPEKHIAVVSHSGFLWSFCQKFGHGLSSAVCDLMHPHFANCEMRTFVLADTSGNLNPQALVEDKLYFPGGDTVPHPVAS
jgi:broad specificity phosphatase PhoE